MHFKLAARMLIRTFESPAGILNLLLLLLKNDHVRSFFNIKTKPFVTKVDLFFLIRQNHPPKSPSSKAIVVKLFGPSLRHIMAKLKTK